ncbi:pyrimidine dimer DNA glycosylase/endonuclease V [Candidatus Nitrosotenuis chungbukensis]|uniref:pyrimidine dimer DNA glycosylase/endonuclease V n=1 Tax=Candidatus Nitrosotenuis chungbukensis TaxID=1353246 RepID=UPI0005B25521|nr:pyrimidine dimer DNA glycosylase/endonuclease V [Candidatus Nitrosotenuis chungbukensis]WKT58629.1 pyrimidine dimer DNA glycosylase/endonuclease V [Candidatus Nitrosotenuis chungbukensis]
MRIWDVSPQMLCRNHLLGEHRELHAIWAILTEDKTGYSFHPETLRWVGKLPALYTRHEKLVKEMKNRGYNHNSPLDKKHAVGIKKQTKFVHSTKQQITILRSKNCNCAV